MKMTVEQLAKRLGARLLGNGSVQVNAVGTVKTAGENEVTFAVNDKHFKALGDSKAAAVIVSKALEGLNKPQLVVRNVDAALIEVMTLFAPCVKPESEGIDPTARVAPSARIAKGVSVGPGVVIADEVCIDENSIIAAGCKIGQNSSIGKNCRLDYNVVVHHNCKIGNNVIIQSNSTIGSTGFGYSFIDGAHRLIPHNGGVIIEDFVEIGANCCIDRAKFGNTVIGAGTKIDNLVQIAHNVIIGRRCLIAGQVGIAGSTTVGDDVVLAGQVGLTDNIEIGTGARAGARSGITHSIPAGQQVFGMPAMEKRLAFRMVASMRRLPDLIEQIRQISSRLKRLEGCAKFNSRLRFAAGMATVILIAFLLSPYSEAVFDPHEYKIEQVVKQYQDGNDNFYVSTSSHLEDLHTGKNVFLIADIAEAVEKIAADHAESKDSFFLISYKDMEKIKNTQAWKLLQFIREVDVEGLQLVLLGAKTNSAPIKPKA